MTRKRLLLLSILVEGVLIVLALGLGLLLGMPLENWVTWSLGGLGAGLAGTVVLLLVLESTRRSPFAPARRLMQLVEDQVKPLFRGCTVLDLVMISLLAGIGEELFFRGFLHGLLEHRVGAGVTLLVSSILFGLAHCISREYALFTGLMGLVLGGLYLLTGDLLASMIAHASYDFAALLLLTDRSATRVNGPGR